MTEANGNANVSPYAEQMRVFLENTRNFPPEELLKYAGQHIAYSIDGTRIVASGATLDELLDRLDAMGVRGSEVVTSYVDEPGVASL